MNAFTRFLRKLTRGRSQIPKGEELFKMVRESPFFRDVPDQNLREMLTFAEAVRVKDADVVIREGEEGDNYYVILDGMASVARRRTVHDNPQVVSVLAPGFAFGEEALISNGRRNATVIMETDGILLRIPKGPFLDFIVSSLVASVTPVEGQRLVNDGAKWLDVRDTADYQRSHLPHALSLPLAEIREQVSGLDPEMTYVCCCENGRQGATAAFLMRLAGYKAVALQGGLRRIDQRFRTSN